MKPKINTDRPPVSSDEILARRDFDGLLKQLPATPGTVVKPLWKSGWFLGSLATAAVLAVGAWVYFDKNDTSNKQPTLDPTANNHVRQPDSSNITGSFMKLTAGAYIQPPLAGVDIPFTTNKLRVAQGGVLKYSTGSQLKFPKNAFVDAAGNVVKGEVDIHFREFHDAVDFFLSGIPMTYDSAGVKYQFESAGMMQVAAFQNGKVVYLKPGQEVEVELASSQTGTNYNLYQLDTTAHNWTYLGKDQVKAMPDELHGDVQNDFVGPIASIDQKEKTKIAELETQREQAIATAVNKISIPEKPIEPRRSDKTKNRFTVKFSPHEFPEMSAYKDVLFEVDESREAFDKNNYGVTWDAIELQKGDRQDRYTLKLTKGVRTVRLDVYPVFAGKSYDDAKKIFDEKFAGYTASLEKRQQAEASERARYEALIGGARVEAAQAREQLNNAMKNSAMSDKVMRMFTIKEFGVFNCDRKENYPQGATLSVNVMNEQKEMITCNTPVYLVDHERNALFTYGENPIDVFTFNPKSRNLIWTVSNGVLFTLQEEGFAQLPTTGQRDLLLKPVNQKFNTAAEMRAYFKL